MPAHTDNDPILLDFPEQFQTERLLIRAPLFGDGPALNAAILESRAELAPFLPFARTLPEPEETESVVRRGRLHFLDRTDLMLILTDRHSGHILGASGLHRIDWKARKFEIGYWIRTSRSGEGLVTEAVRGITDFAAAHLEANRVEIRCDDRNARSAAVARRAGFTLDGVLRNWKREEDGTLIHEMIFSKVRGTDF
ncbi:GNAT family N-acetyltransferase [Saccharibacillus sp. CPCC 101409]|uniref:GNAT family N-acetyltransferase n=1 Tax=Saccharibacillus sp. CPCC 101409 TaxID=3058041 RepID=UPI002673AF06|nr:GNAT family N-acetyltransferase [Saccharibacillus sp. CPCC 101409]MDO3410831.1 GNAT family N-acetyltransferase [Saccharibacillus sp. CPCC 101409]